MSLPTVLEEVVPVFGPDALHVGVVPVPYAVLGALRALAGGELAPGEGATLQAAGAAALELVVVRPPGNLLLLGLRGGAGQLLRPKALAVLLDTVDGLRERLAAEDDASGADNDKRRWARGALDEVEVRRATLAAAAGVAALAAGAATQAVERRARALGLAAGAERGDAQAAEATAALRDVLAADAGDAEAAALLAATVTGGAALLRQRAAICR
ncbi:MAG TPA: hypothetical protein VG389_29630, partial [Myxococcota bacterium]|nr:hypothetical protein [Myxococcota bacterium]